MWVYCAEYEREDAAAAAAGHPRVPRPRAAQRMPNHDGTSFVELSSDEELSESDPEWAMTGEVEEVAGTEEEEAESEEVDDYPTSPPRSAMTLLEKRGRQSQPGAYCLPCLSEAEAFSVSDGPNIQTTGDLFK